jgi:eukaryotic translation initiation factor 2-alpha kinase 4
MSTSPPRPPPPPPWDTVWTLQHESVEWSPRPQLHATRHRTDFVALERLGRGAYGVVTKVRHKLDGGVYALKQVRLPSTALPIQEPLDISDVVLVSADRSTPPPSAINHGPLQSVVLREVQLLSRVQHENVVRYYGAWIEPGDNGKDDEDDNAFDKDNESSPTTNSLDNDHSTWTQSTDHRAAASMESASLVQCHLCNSYYTDWEVSFEQWGLIDAVLQPLNLCTTCYRQSLPLDQASSIQIRPKVPPIYYLFILMEYCGSGTLAEILQESSRGHVESLSFSRRWSYFVQCVQGVAACHAVGCIHRDLKPNNIFVADQTVKIGDLGLATTTTTTDTSSDRSRHHQRTSQQSEHATNALTGEPDEHKTSQIGTYLYSAPEVATGIYTEKCDIYSLGVVLVELFCDFATSMERAVALDRLRPCPVEQTVITLPEELSARYPAVASLARLMLDADPTVRPTCGAILTEWVEPHVSSSSPPPPPPLSLRAPAQQQETAMAPTTTVDSATVDDVTAPLVARIGHLQRVVQAKDATIEHLRNLLQHHGIAIPE